MFCHVVVAMMIVSGDPDAATPPYQDLAESFVESLRNRDIAAYSQCWLPFRRMQVFARASKPPIPVEQLEAYGEYFQSRNKQIAYSFDVLCKLLGMAGNIDELKLVDVTIGGMIRERNGIRQISTFYIKVALGESQFQIDIDDGAEDGGLWYFTDKPIHVRGPDGKFLPLTKMLEE